MNDSNSELGQKTTRRLLDIESKARLTSKTIGVLSNRPILLKEYLDASVANTFSELMFRLTHEIYEEEKASALWHNIANHRKNIEKLLHRDVGTLVAALDYLSNISGDILSPKIMGDLQIEEAAAMATRDTLTGLYLRGVFDFSLDRMVQEHVRNRRNLSLLMLDIDDFKFVNDNYGHQVGDEVLHRLGEIIIGSIRSKDFAARYGGEEVAIIFPETSIDQAAILTERLRAEICRLFADNGPKITVSIGISSIHEPDAVTASELICKADKALYKVKRTGKNSVGWSSKVVLDEDAS